MVTRLCRLAMAVALAAPAAPFAKAQPVAEVAVQLSAPEAEQGVASDGTYVFAIDNSTIARYRIADGRRMAIWHGDPALFPHINSCTLAESALVCAASNYPQLPQLSTIEFFDPETLVHTRSVSLGMAPGSLTVVMRHDDAWWAIFANYDGRGGDPARDHRYTLLAQLDDEFGIQRGWAMPQAVLDCLKPRSASGAAWTEDGRLLVSGHDRPQIYVLSLPEAGGVLHYEGWFPVTTHGQAIGVSSGGPGLIWSINRPTREIVASVIPGEMSGEAPPCQSAVE